MKSLIALILIMLLAGCSRTEILEKMAPDDMKAQAIEILEGLRKGNGEETFALLPESVKDEAAKQALAELAIVIPDEDYTNLTFVNYQWRRTNGEAYHYFLFEYDFDGKYLLADITFWKNEDEAFIVGINAQKNDISIIEASKFNFKDTGIVHYGFLAAVTIFPVFSIWSLVVCIRTKGLKRKWGWCIFILIGFMSFKLNWSTGQWGWQPLSFQLLSGSATSAGAYGPWILGFSVPVGAVAFWDKRKKLKAQAVDNDTVG